MKKHLTLFISCLLTSLLTSTVSFASLGLGIQFVGDSIEKDPVSSVVQIKGSAHLSQKDHQLKADNIKINTKSGEVIATGHCQYEFGKTTLRDERLQFQITDGEWLITTVK